MANITPLTGELNFVINYFWNGCRAPFTLYAETSLPLAGEVAIVLLGFDWQDITTAFFRPKGLRSARHGRKSAKKRGSGGVPQIPDLIAEHTPTIDEFAQYVVTDSNKIWWKLEAAIERTTWTVALIELTHDFAYKSLLGVLSLKQVKCDVAGRAFATGQQWTMFNNGAAYLVELGTIVYAEYPCRVEHSVVYFDDAKDYLIMVEATGYNMGDTAILPPVNRPQTSAVSLSKVPASVASSKPHEARSA